MLEENRQVIQKEDDPEQGRRAGAWPEDFITRKQQS